MTERIQDSIMQTLLESIEHSTHIDVRRDRAGDLSIARFYDLSRKPERKIFTIFVGETLITLREEMKAASTDDTIEAKLIVALQNNINSIDLSLNDPTIWKKIKSWLFQMGLIFHDDFDA